MNVAQRPHVAGPRGPSNANSKPHHFVFLSDDEDAALTDFVLESLWTKTLEAPAVTLIAKACLAGDQFSVLDAAFVATLITEDL